MPNALGWLTQFDVESSYLPRRVDVLHPVEWGERRDYLWVAVNPPIAPGEAANAEELSFVLLAPRHQDHPLSIPVRDPTHVHVCRVRGATTGVPARVNPEEVEILHWGIVSPSASG
jgi:hypothetical protein